VASALVLHYDAQNVWKRSNAGQATDATSRTRLGNDRDGSGHLQKTSRVVAIYSVGEGADGSACWVSVLS